MEEKASYIYVKALHFAASVLTNTVFKFTVRVK